MSRANTSKLTSRHKRVLEHLQAASNPIERTGAAIRMSMDWDKPTCDDAILVGPGAVVNDGSVTASNTISENYVEDRRIQVFNLFCRLLPGDAVPSPEALSKNHADHLDQCKRAVEQRTSVQRKS